ncbi:hypothetical protein EMCG_07693 [[Emmonsia] crescens]|uniref:Protein kinase domain-containing protein n=1 Tax=[Emmonsia] crescens TaxID=73230 RepID=A0A0G2J5A8_9EURO|nr:hypothetical protein EMCG_07693 [Emmonsia crescens UAMH 3008]
MAPEGEIEKLRQLLEEARLEREEIQREREEEQREREEIQREREEERRGHEKVEKRIRKTTVPELLDACHVHLFLGLKIQNHKMSTQGDPANATNKDFPTQQEAIWNDLMDSDFMLERHFTSIHTLEESGNTARGRSVGSELDLYHFLRFSIEDHVSAVIEQLNLNPPLQEKFNLKGYVRFENHGNTLSPERHLEEDMQNLSFTNPQQRWSPRLLANAQRMIQAGLNEQRRPVTEARPARPRADQFCVYNIPRTATETEHRVAVLIGENKSPAKLPLNFIYQGLEDMDLEDVVTSRKNETSRDRFRRLVAAVITQAFSYMIRAGLEYGYVCTGEAFIFLRIPDDPTTVFYFLSVPEGDAGKTTGWTPDLDHPNRLHLTAVGQSLAFTLQALRTQPRGQSWRRRAEEQLKTWKVVFEDIRLAIPKEDDTASSEYKPPHGGHDFLRMSPVRLRPRRVSNTLAGCHPPQSHTQDDSDDKFDPNTPSRAQRPNIIPSQHKLQTSSTSTEQPWRETRHKGNKRRYCTQRCLLGLQRGGLLDEDCPNVRDHGTHCHRINQPTFLNLMRRQLSADLDTDCDSVGVHGARGALLKVTLTSHGYTVTAKCTTRECVQDLEHEARIYKQLQPIQGIHIPVNLGSLNLKHSYHYEGVTKLVRMMFLSFGGWPIWRAINLDNQASLIEQVTCSFRAIHQLGVWHRDAMPRNILSNAESGQVIVIDFERSRIIKPRVMLGAVSPNRKRKGKSEDISHKSPECNGGVLQQELQGAIYELRVLTYGA